MSTVRTQAASHPENGHWHPNTITVGTDIHSTNWRKNEISTHTKVQHIKQYFWRRWQVF